MKKDLQYRWSIKTGNVYSFLMFYGEGFTCGTLASYKNEVSGFVRKSNLPKLSAALISRGYSIKDKNIKLISSETYWNNWDKYNN